MARKKFIIATPVARFMAKVDVQPNGCWLWKGCLRPSGYGMFRLDSSSMKAAHRVSYQIFVGAIPDRLEIDHTCHDPNICHKGDLCPHRRCVNPDHLELSTHANNSSKERSVKTGVIKAVEALRAITHCPSGHEYTEDNTYLYKDTWRYCRMCALLKGRKRSADKAAKRLAYLADSPPPEPPVPAP